MTFLISQCAAIPGSAMQCISQYGTGFRLGGPGRPPYGVIGIHWILAGDVVFQDDLDSVDRVHE